MMKNINRKIIAITLAITSVTTTVMMPASAAWSSTPFTFTTGTYTYQDYQKSVAETTGGPTLTSYANTGYGTRFENYTKTPYQYNGLTKQEKNLYNSIMKLVKAGKTEIKISENTTETQLKNVIRVISKYGCGASFEYYAKTRTLEVLDSTPNDTFVEIADAIEANFPKNASDYDKIKAIHDEICRRYKYGFSEGNVLTAEKLLCSGYTWLFEGFCKYFNINCTTICSESHSWNKVELDGNWYNVDVCWDDGSKIRYNYFLISDSKLAKLDSGEDHKAISTKNLPKCPKSYSKK